MVELENQSGRRYTVKLSEEKHSLPGAKQIFRYVDHDQVARSGECPSCHDDPKPEALLRPVLLGGRLVEPLPGIAEVRRHASECMARLPAPCLSLFEDEHAWRVEISPRLQGLYEKVRQGVAL